MITTIDELKDPEYLGDGLYVGHDGYQIWLAASNGERISNAVALEPRVLEQFMRYLISHELLESLKS